MISVGRLMSGIDELMKSAEFVFDLAEFVIII